MIAVVHIHGWDWFWLAIICLGFFLMGMGVAESRSARR